MVGFSGFSSQKGALIRLTKICKEYACGPSAVKAVRNASMSLEPGEFVLLQGPSGSGKTTLLSIMGCLMKPSAGRVFICGKDVTEMSESELPRVRLEHIGFIFQSFNLFPALTAFENVKLALQLKGFGWRMRRKEAQRLLERVGLGQCMHRKPSDLSGGQRQRICIARALAGNVDVILADEPTAALDTQTGVAIIELLKEESKKGSRACLVVTHDPRLEKYATRVDRITDGMLSVGTPPRIRSAGPGNDSGAHPSPIDHHRQHGPVLAHAAGSSAHISAATHDAVKR